MCRPIQMLSSHLDKTCVDFRCKYTHFSDTDVKKDKVHIKHSENQQHIFEYFSTSRQFFHYFQIRLLFFLTFKRTEIANHGIKDVEVGHCRGDAVELVHQRRLDIIEKLGAHKAWRVWRFAFQTLQKSNRELLSTPRLWNTYSTNRKLTVCP